MTEIRKIRAKSENGAFGPVIGDDTFVDCPGLTQVTISNSVTSIDVHAFRKCPSLASIVIPNSVESIGVRAFDGCTSLTSVVIPDSMQSISGNAFERCNLEYVGIYNGEETLTQGVLASINDLSTEAIALTPRSIDRLSIDLWQTLIASGKQLHKLLITNTPFEKRFNQYLKSVFINLIASQIKANVPQLPREIVINITSYVSSHHFYEKQREITSTEINRISEKKHALAIQREL